MSKRFVTYALLVVLLNITCARWTAANPVTAREARFIQKLKDGISKLGTGRQARIKVELRDKTKLSGYIMRADDETFVILDDKTGQPIPVAYPQVKQAKGNNLSSGAKLAIVLAVLGALAVLIIVSVPKT